MVVSPSRLRLPANPLRIAAAPPRPVSGAYLVATTSGRGLRRASAPTSCSLLPQPYASAVSNRSRPAWRDASNAATTSPGPWLSSYCQNPLSPHAQHPTPSRATSSGLRPSRTRESILRAVRLGEISTTDERSHRPGAPAALRPAAPRQRAVGH